MYRFGLFFASVLIGTVTLSGSPHRTPWGDPDLPGIWSNQTPTPLERPDALAGKTHRTEAEAAEFDKMLLYWSADDLRFLKCRPAASSTRFGSKRAKEKFRRAGALRSSWTRRMGSPADTPEGWKRWDAVPKMGKPLLANVPEDRNQMERCLTSDGLLVPNPFDNNYFEIVQAPGYVAIVTEMTHETRIIPLC